MTPHLFPAPREAHFGAPTFDLSSRHRILVDASFSPNLTTQATRFACRIGESFTRKPEVSSRLHRDGQTLLTIHPALSTIHPQGYSISATEGGIEIKAGDERGAFYALTTLEQILLQTGSAVPDFRISDAPDFEQRGMMLDVSRCKVPTMDSLKAYVDLLASLKINQLQLYTEHTFAFSRHETVWFDSSPITAEETRELDRYCAEHYIQLVPTFNSFGHFERWLKHPEYRHLAECPDGFDYPWGGRSKSGGVLYPDETSLRFIDSLYDELLPNFSSNLFNIGCDETWELGKGRSRTEADAHGAEQVYLGFLLKLASLVEQHGRQMMFWGDIILKRPELVKTLPKDIIALNWGYEADHPYRDECATFAEAGVPFYVCPGTSSWNSLIGMWDKARKNLANAADNGLTYGAKGFLITDWGDGGHHQYPPISYPGIVTGACFSWCYKTNRDVDTAKGLDLLIFKDRKEVLGTLLLDTSKVQKCIPAMVDNASAFGRILFFNNKEIRETYADVPRECFEKAMAAFAGIKESIQGAQPGASDALLVKEEMVAAIHMAEFATVRAMAQLWPERGYSKKLKHALQHIIRIHEELWLARNRHGGLRESSDRLRQVFEYI